MRIARGDQKWDLGVCITVGIYGRQAQEARIKQDEGLEQEFSPFGGPLA